MDVLPEWPIYIPSIGVLGVLVWLIVHLMRQSSGDRGDYQQRVIEVRQQHSDEIQQLTTRHDAQIAELRADIGVLRAEISDLRQQIEDERKARWEAEDAAARFRRMVNGVGDVTEANDDAT